jgi:hypothetical protein
MTAQQSQREYIIIEDDIHTAIFRLQKEGWRPDGAWLNQFLRFRPHTPTPDTMTISVKEFEQYIKDKQEQAAHIATLATYDEVLYNIDGETGFYCFPDPKSTLGNGMSQFVLLEDLIKLVNTPRQSTTVAQEDK